MSRYEIKKGSYSPLKKNKKRVEWSISRKSSIDQHERRNLIYRKLRRT